MYSVVWNQLVGLVNTPATKLEGTDKKDKIENYVTIKDTPNIAYGPYEKFRTKDIKPHMT